MIDVVLFPGRDKSARRRHPWVLSGAVARVLDTGEQSAGAWARVVSAEGETLGFGHYSPASQIRVRLLAFGKDPPEDALIFERVSQAVARRAGDPLIGETDAVRLVNSEADGLPGLVVDRYGDVVVMKLGSAGMSARRALLVSALREATSAASGFERADAAAARREGVAVHQGPLWGAVPDARIWIRERGRRYVVNLVHGQKTGFYLDQRDSRDLVESLAAGRRVLDLFAYTGGFSVAAGRAGAASLTVVESSAEALALARENVAAAAHTPETAFFETDAFRFIRQDAGCYDLIVIDPPALARRAGDAQRAARAHKDVLLFALRRAAPGALVFAFSCSHSVDAKLLRQVAFAASLDAARPAQVIRELGAPADHPVSLDHPEGVYLKGLLLRA
ncbi:MAG TPA: class I SAM-dependent rRNA methyltransferase [Myxococcota bacterium]|nr:class I SAM-dependent rRNA methyltransferase [Myxococcota bacterium]